MRHEGPTPPSPDRLGLTEAVPVHGFAPQGRGDLGTDLRRSDEARRGA